MTMPQGASGLDLQQWLQDHQGNASPPTDPWITPFTSSNNLSNLKNRTEPNIRTHYEEQLPNLGVYNTSTGPDMSWWDGLVDAFTNIVGSLPEWLSGLQTVLVWVGTNFDATFRPVFEWFSEIIIWLKDNVAAQIIKNIFDTLKTINNSITLPIFEGLIQALSKFQPVLDWFSATIGATVGNFWDGIVSILEWIDTNLSVPVVQNLLSFFDAVSGAFSNTLTTVLTPALEFLGWVFENLLNNDFSNGIKDLLTRAYQFLEYLFQTLFPGAITGAITQIADFLKWLTTSFSGTIQTVLQPIFTALNWVWTNLSRGTVSVLNSLVAPTATFFDWVFNDLFAGSWTAVQNILAPAFEFLKYLLSLFNLSGLQDVFGTFKSMVNQFGSVFEWVDQLAGVQWIKGIVQSITGVVSETLSGALTALLGWAQNIPGVSMIIAGILGPWKNPATGTNTTLPDLIAWSTRQLTIDTVVPSQNLVGYVPQELMALLPVGHMSDVQPNLVTDQGFASDAALQSGAGWSWSGDTATGSSGGSAKVVGDGGIKQLFSNLIAVSPGQQLSISARAKWTKSFTAVPQIVVGVRGYEGEVVKFTTIGASVSAASGYTSTLNASSYNVPAGTTASFSNGWVTITGSFTIPAVTAGYTTSNCRLYIGVLNAPAGTTVWFDEVVMKKTSLLPQDLVKELSTDLGNKLPGTKFDELLQNIANKTGATVDDVKNKLATFLNTGTSLYGNTPTYDAATGKYVVNGDITSAFISELVDTWNKIKAGAGNNAPASNGSGLQDAGKSLGDLAGSVSDNAVLMNLASKDITDLKALTSNHATAIKQLLTDVSTLQGKVGTTPTPPPPSETIISVVDTFERASLGTSWTTPYLAYPGDGSTFGIYNTHDVKLTPGSIGSGAYPALASNSNMTWVNYGATIRQQTANDLSTYKSNSLYQRVYGSIASIGSFNGTLNSGWNDLIGRAGGVSACIIARFWANGKVQLISKTPTGGMGTETVFGTTTMTIAAGANIELRCGNKAKGDPWECTVKVGSATYTAPCPSNSSLGQGWGFGMGTGIYTVTGTQRAALPAGTVGSWGAEDQT